MHLFRNAVHNVRTQLGCCLVRTTRYRQNALPQGASPQLCQLHQTPACTSSLVSGPQHRPRQTVTASAGGSSSSISSSSSSSAGLEHADAPTGRRSRRTRSTHVGTGPVIQQDSIAAADSATVLKADRGSPLQARGRRRGVDAGADTNKAPAGQAAAATEQLQPDLPAGEGAHKAGRRAARGSKAATSGAAAAAATAAGTAAASGAGSPSSGSRSATESGSSSSSSTNTSIVHGPHLGHCQPLPRVLMLHTGGTLGMDAATSFEVDPTEVPHQPPVLRRGTGGIYGGLEPGQMLSNIFQQVPELGTFANLDLQVVFNKDSSRVGPREWVQIAKILDKYRHAYDAFLIVHGTDTMAFTASALSLMLGGFRKPIVMTGSQLPLSSPRSDARQNLIDALTCATASYKPPHPPALNEVAVCFGGRLMRGNRTRKVNSSIYQAFDSPGFPYLASLGVDVEWNERYLLRAEGGYVPRFKLETAVLRVPVVPGSDPRIAYGDLSERGVKGIVLEAFGVGNFPDLPLQGWVPWLRQQTRKGLQVYLASQCHLGPLKPELYKSGALALEMGVEAGPQMTPECAVVKMMLCLAYPDIALGQPLAGEL